MVVVSGAAGPVLGRSWAGRRFPGALFWPVLGRFRPCGAGFCPQERKYVPRPYFRAKLDFLETVLWEVAKTAGKFFRLP